MRHKANRCPNRRLGTGIARILKVEEEIGLDKTRDDAFHAQIQENRRKDDTESQQEKSQKAWNRLHIVGQERLYQNCQTEYDPDEQQHEFQQPRAGIIGNFQPQIIDEVEQRPFVVEGVTVHCTTLRHDRRYIMEHVGIHAAQRHMKDVRRRLHTDNK